MFSRMLKLPDEVRAAADVSSLEVVIHAAAPCPVPVKEQMIEWFGPILLEYYAATEGNGCTFITSPDWLAHPGSVGRSVLSDIQILDDDGRPCPVGTSGTVWFAGATDFEYFNDPDKTAGSRRDDGKTSTVGDVGYLDADGYLFLTDRKAHMIISGGVNIYPQETENLLVTHPAVLDAAVIGVPNEDLGEEVKAVVQLVGGVDGRRGSGGCADRVLSRASGPLQVPAQCGLRGRAAPTAHREVVQGCVARAVLGGARHADRVSDARGRAARRSGLVDGSSRWGPGGAGRPHAGGRTQGGVVRRPGRGGRDGGVVLPALRPLRPRANEGSMDAAPRSDGLSGPAGRACAGTPRARRAPGAPGHAVGAGGGRELVLPHRRSGRAGGDGAGLHDEAGGVARARRHGARSPGLSAR